MMPVTDNLYIPKMLSDRRSGCWHSPRDRMLVETISRAAAVALNSTSPGDIKGWVIWMR